MLAARTVLHGRPSLHFLVPAVACLSSKSPPAAHIAKLPLFLKPLKYSATVKDLQVWHSWAADLATSVGSSFVHMDNGPDSDLLKRELNWLLEDSLADVSVSKHLRSAVAEDPTLSVSTRLPLDELYNLWEERIVRRRPFQYVVGCEHWRDMVLCVQEGVLIPRPETEIIVDLVEEAIGSARLGNGVWADLGTGSGAIAIGIARVLGASGSVIATDVSPVAIRVASFNIHRYELQDKIEVREGNWFDPLKDVEGKLAGLVSNPPYIPSDDIPVLQAEVGRHEPRLALDGGISGMDCLQHLIDGAAAMLAPGGFFVLETNGEKHCNSLLSLVENDRRSSFENAKVVPDFAGINRFLVGFRR